MKKEKEVVLEQPEKVEEAPKADKPKKKKKALRIIGEVVFWAFIGCCVFAALAHGIDKHTDYSFPIFGMRTSVVVSPSMSYKNAENTYLTDDMKQIQKNDIVLTKNYKSYDEIKIYDVITYVTRDNGLICHRVIEKYESEGKQYLVTKGDANTAADEPIAYSLVRGKVVSVTHGGGQVLLFVQSPYFIIGLFASCFFVFLGMFIFDIEKAKRKPKAETVVETVEPVPTEPVHEEEPEEAPVEEPVVKKPTPKKTAVKKPAATKTTKEAPKTTPKGKKPSTKTEKKL